MGRSPFHYAAIFNSGLDIIKLLSDDQYHDINQKDSSNTAPIKFAAQFSGQELLNFFDERGSIKSYPIYGRKNLLHIAAEFNPHDEAVIFISKRINHCYCDIQARSGLELVVMHSKNSSILWKMISQNFSQSTKSLKWGQKNILELAVKERNLNSIKYLIQNYQYLLHQINLSGRLPIHNAAISNTSLQVLTMLIQGGSQINAKDHANNDTPLHCAARWSKDQAVIRVLVENGADFKALNMQILTPFQYSKRHSDSYQIIEYLQGLCS